MLFAFNNTDLEILSLQALSILLQSTINCSWQDAIPSVFVCLAVLLILAVGDSIVFFLLLVALWLARRLSYALSTGCNMVRVLNTCLFKVSLRYYIRS